MEDDRRRDDVRLAELARDMVYIKETLQRIDTHVMANYVSKEEFEPIKRVVYGLVSLILTAVVGGLLALVVSK